jgi:Sulfotransferase family
LALPDFFVIGAPKAGTTALHVALAQHPSLFMSRVKEPKFFLTDGPPPGGRGPGDAATYRKYVWRRADYEALFDAAPQGSLRGESTTLYLRNAEACRRIREMVPDARLIAVLRDPVDRAHSNWTHLHSAGLEPEADFRRACAQEERRMAAGWAQFWRYIGQGKYGEQLSDLYSLFPREQVLLLMYRDLRERPIEALDQVCDFLGVATGAVTELPAENVTAQASHSLINRVLRTVVRHGGTVDDRLPGPMRRAVSGRAERLLQREQGLRKPLTTAERAELIPHFEADIELLESITGRSFDHWRDLRNGVVRQPLVVRGRFGTAHGSIDRPLKS